MRKKYLKSIIRNSLLCFCFLLITTGLAYPLSTGETAARFLEITSLKVETDVLMEGISGMRISFDANLKEKDSGGVPAIIAHVLDKKNQQVKAAVENSRYNIDGKAGSSRSGYIIHPPIQMFIPYYVLGLDAGQQALKIKISANLRHGTEQPQPLECHGQTEQAITINKPAIKKFRLYLKEIRVEERNLADNNWDNGGGRSRLPDLKYRIELGARANVDVAFSSNTVKNSLSAAWLDYSDVVTISCGDLVTLVVYDKDTMFDDPMGRIKIKLEELKTISEKQEKIRFGMVTSCLLAVEIVQ